MGTTQIVIGSVLGLVAVLLGIYVSFTARGKGPVLSNRYILASNEERRRMDVKYEYRLVTIIFGCLTGIFTLLSVYVFTGLKWLYVLKILLIVFVTVYAIAESIRFEMKRK